MDTRKKETLISLTDNHFQSIYDLAKAKKKTTLHILKKNEVCFEVKRGQFSPAGLLAYEGDHDSVQFLKENFNVEIDGIAFGYALAGDTVKAKQLIQEGANPSFVMRGFAKRDNQEMVDYCLGRAALMSSHCLTRDSLLSSMMMGFASGKLATKVNELAQTMLPVISMAFENIISAEGFLDYRPYVISAAYMYALEGHTDLLEDLFIFVQKLDASDKENELVHWDIFPAIERYQECLNRAASGYAQGQQLAKAMNLKERGASLDSLISGCAIIGDTENVEKFLKEGGDIEAAMFGFYHSYRFYSKETTLELLSFIQDPSIRNNIAKLAISYLPACNSAALVATAEKINTLMNQKDCSYNQAKNIVANENLYTPRLFGNAPVSVTAHEEFTLFLP